MHDWGLRSADFYRHGSIGRMNFFEPPARTEYAMWNQGWDWLVIAHERVGTPNLAVVSVQFHPPSVRLPKEKAKPQEPFGLAKTILKRARELEPA